MKFTTATAIAVLASVAAAAKDKRSFAVLRFTNKQLTKTRVDPIMNPGTLSGHVHTVLGGSNFGMNSTGETLRDSKCTNALIKGDMSNYWFPSLYFKDPKTGALEAVELFYSNIYYFFEPTNDEIKAFPLGLSMIIGDSTLRSPPEGGASSNLDPSKGPVNPIKWTCPRSGNNYSPPSWPEDSDGTMAGIGDPRNKGEGVGFPDQNCDGYASPLRGDTHFPSCYNPKAGLTNWKENMAWPTDAGNGKKDCPKGYTHHPHLFFEAYWNTPAFKDRWEQGKGTQPFVLSNGDATGYGQHADFMSGWDEKLLQHIIDTCDAGSSGMDKCPGLFYGLNKEECTIPSLVDEKVDGILPKLPGKNQISGWAYGEGDGNTNPNPNPSPNPPSNSAPSSGGNDNPTKTTSKPASPTTISPDTTKSPDSPTYGVPQPSKPLAPVSNNPGSPSGCTQKIHTVWQTVTVTAGQPGPTDAPNNNSTVSIAGFKYAGCFKDSNDRVLSGKIRPNLGAVSNDNCVKHCQSAGFTVAGTEYGGQCYCGNELVGSKKLDDSACSMACEGNAEQMCGGSWALSVYSKDGDVIVKSGKVRRAHEHLHLHKHRSI